MVYQSNDDVVLRLIAEGHLVPGVGPSPFLVLINVIVGKLLASLYTIAPAVPWYDLLMIASLCAAAAALLWAWGRRELHWTIVFAVVLLLPAFARMHYTVAAMLCAAGGLALIARDRPMLGALLLVWGSLLRFEAAMLIVVLAAPFLIARWRVLLVACGIAVALFGVNRAVYRMTPGWEDFYEFYALRVRIAEYTPESRITPEVLSRLKAEAGWSANDLALFTDWFHVLYTVDEARRAAAVIDTSPSPAQAVESVRTFVWSMRWLLLLLCAWVLGRSRRTVLRFVAVIAAMVVLIAILGMISKPPPPWISFPIVVCGGMLLLLGAGQRPAIRPASGRRSWITIAAMTLAALIAIRQTRSVWTAAAPAAALNIPKGTLTILHGGAYPYEKNWRPFREPRETFAFVSIAATAHMPPVKNFLLARDLCSEDMLLVAYPHVPRRLVRYHAERGRRVHFEEASPIVWRCRAEPTPLPPPARPSSPATAGGAAGGG